MDVCLVLRPTGMGDTIEISSLEGIVAFIASHFHSYQHPTGLSYSDFYVVV